MSTLSAIPPLIHLIWYQGWEQRPTFGRQYAETWEMEHPHYTVLKWDQSKLEKVFADLLPEDIKQTIDSLPEIVQKVDLWRLVILKYLGGIYVDLDFICLRNISDYLYGYEFVVSEEHDGIIANGFIATTESHPLIQKAIDSIIHYGLPKSISWENDVAIRQTKRYVLETTGPHIISLIWRKEIESMTPGDRKLVHVETDTQKFFPMKYDEYDVSKQDVDIESAKQEYPDSYAVHIYWGSWTYNKNLFKV